MGSLCSKASTHSGGHTVLGSGAEPGSPQAAPRNETPEQRRERMAAAAKERQQRDMQRLTNKKNPNAGRLASQMNKPVNSTASERQDEPLRWD